MDFEFTEDQEMFKHSVRDFLDKECPRSVVRNIEDNKLDYSAEIYKKMANLGWLGLMIPEEYNGTAGDWVTTAIFYEEAGRALLQSPHLSTVILAAQSIISLGNEKQKKELLPQISQGKVTYAFADTESDPGLKLRSITTTARPDGDGYIVAGTKLFISFAHVTDRIVVVAREEGNAAKLFIVDKGTPGLICIPYDTMSGERLCEVVLNEVKVSKTATMGKDMSWETIEEIISNAKLMTCASALGSAQMELELIVDYAKQRIIFGHPIGAYQALQHKLADIALAIEGARWLVYSAAWMLSHGILCDKERAMAQLYTRAIYPRIAEEVAHCHGAVALVKDHDMTLYYRRAKSIQLNLDFSDSYVDLIANQIGI